MFNGVPEVPPGNPIEAPQEQPRPDIPPGGPVELPEPGPELPSSPPIEVPSTPEARARSAVGYPQLQVPSMTRPCLYV
jgi:hypothetical protein